MYHCEHQLRRKFYAMDKYSVLCLEVNYSDFISYFMINFLFVALFVFSVLCFLCLCLLFILCAVGGAVSVSPVTQQRIAQDNVNYSADWLIRLDWWVLTFWHCHTLSQTLSLCLSLAHSLTLSPTHLLTLSLTHSLTLSLSHSLSLSRPSITHFTHSLHSHSPTHSLTHSHSLISLNSSHPAHSLTGDIDSLTQWHSLSLLFTCVPS